MHPWAINAFQSRVQRLTSQIEASSDGFQVTAPTDALTTAAGSSRTARRLLLLAVRAGRCSSRSRSWPPRVSRDVTDARRRRRGFGARRWQVELFTLAESTALAALGTLVGWVLGGAVVVAFAAERAGSPAGEVVSHALLSSGGLLAALGVALVAGLLLFVVRDRRAHRAGRPAEPHALLDAAALGAVGVVLVGGRAVPSTCSNSRRATGLSALLVALIVFAAAVFAARRLDAARALGRAGRRGPIALRLAAAARSDPDTWLIAATFLVASLGLALFALVAYRSTLIRGQHDEAAYAVPAEYVLSEDLSQLVPVLHGPAPYPGRPRCCASPATAAGTTFTFLALGNLENVGGWRTDFASRPLDACSWWGDRPAPRHVAPHVGAPARPPVLGPGDNQG